MPIFESRGVYVLAIFFILLCVGRLHSQEKRPTHFHQNAMSIDYHITVADPLTPERIEKTKEVIENTFKEIDNIYNKWNPQSELSKLNDLPAHTPVTLSPQLNQFFQRVDYLVNLSEGRFDPTVESIQQLWKKKLEQGLYPSEEEIRNLKPSVGWNTLHIANGVFTKEDGRTQIDLGGVAKGYCVDLLVERLHQTGLNHLFVEWGGEIRTLGRHPFNRPWRIMISPSGNPDPSQAIAQIDSFDQAIATSGDYFQYWEVINSQGEKKTYCHIFNPLTLSPIEVKKGSVASASLLASDCMTADALAKVLMLFDSTEEARQWMKQLQSALPGIEYWILVRDEDKN